MANPEHLDLLRQGVDVWNAWRTKERFTHPDLPRSSLSGANLSGANLVQADLSEADLRGAKLNDATLVGADLSRADLSGANLVQANLAQTNLSEAILHGADLSAASLRGATLAGADVSTAFLGDANLSVANLTGANLSKANFSMADLSMADLSAANLRGANLSKADLTQTNLSKADLHGAHLSKAMLVETNLADAVVTSCRTYGISAWDVLCEGTKQQDLVVTRWDQPTVVVDNIEVAQFVYLLLSNEKIRDVIDTVGKKGVLLLGRFTEGRIEVLNQLREELRKRGYVPIVFNFDKPETKDFTETVRLLAGLSKFVIADLSSPRSAPYELGAVVSQTMIPFQPIIEAGDKPFAMLRDLWTSYRDRVLEPIEYSSVDRLVETIDTEIIEPAEVRFKELAMRKAETLPVRRVV